MYNLEQQQERREKLGKKAVIYTSMDCIWT